MPLEGSASKQKILPCFALSQAHGYMRGQRLPFNLYLYVLTAWGRRPPFPLDCYTVVCWCWCRLSRCSFIPEISRSANNLGFFFICMSQFFVVSTIWGQMLDQHQHVSPRLPVIWYTAVKPVLFLYIVEFWIYWKSLHLLFGSLTGESHCWSPALTEQMVFCWEGKSKMILMWCSDIQLRILTCLKSLMWRSNSVKVHPPFTTFNFFTR